MAIIQQPSQASLPSSQTTDEKFVELSEEIAELVDELVDELTDKELSSSFELRELADVNDQTAAEKELEAIFHKLACADARIEEKQASIDNLREETKKMLDELNAKISYVERTT